MRTYQTSNTSSSLLGYQPSSQYHSARCCPEWQVDRRQPCQLFAGEMLELTVCASSAPTPRTRRNFSSRCVSSYHHHQNHVLCPSLVGPLLSERSTSTWCVSSTQQTQRLLCKWRPDDHRLVFGEAAHRLFKCLLDNEQHCSTLYYLTKWISVIIYVTATTTGYWWENQRTLITLLSSLECYSRTLIDVFIYLLLLVC